MSDITLRVGESDWTIQSPGERQVGARPRVPPSAIVDVPAALRNALEHPFRLDFPLRRALTPDDRVALVIDEQLPCLGTMLAEMLGYLRSAGIGPESVTILTETAAGPQNWIDELPDEFADVHTENHQPDDRKRLSYLATMKKGRRVYLNRTLLDADQIVSISGRRFDPILGYSGCEGSLYPALSDIDTRRAMWDEPAFVVPSPEPSGIRAEAAEVAFLLSSTIYVQAIEGHGDTISHLVAGLNDSSAVGIQALEERWRFEVPEPVDVVVGAIGGDPRLVDFSTLSRAVAGCSWAIKDAGAIVILTEGQPTLGEGLELIRTAEDPKAALRLLSGKRPADMAAAVAWTRVAQKCRIYLASGLNPDVVEELFATPIGSSGEVQRLVDSCGTCLVLPDAHKCLAIAGGDG